MNFRKSGVQAGKTISRERRNARGKKGSSPWPRRVTFDVVGLGRGFEPAVVAANMHELSIMESALNLALDQAQQAGASRVHRIHLRIGTLSGVVPEALQFAFEALAPGTLAEGARLTIDPVPARFWCADCAQEFAADDFFAECPACRRPSGDLRAGREMELASLEIETGPDPAGEPRRELNHV
jgi:hydrogenase nickel incorporation protein HypA/HybF